MKLNLNELLKDLDGKEIAGENLGKMLAKVLASSSEGDPIKFMSWALSLHKGEPIELDLSDAELLRNFIQANRLITNLAKNEMLVQIINSRDAKN